MKKILLCSCCILVVLISCKTVSMNQQPDYIKIQAKPHESGKWKLVWHDEFNGSAIDTSKWSKVSQGKSDWDRHMSHYDSCYKIEDGKLCLRGIRNPDTTTDKRPFLTGGIYSKGKFAFQYGKIEIMAKLECAQGAWPAMWMLAEQEKYGKYPRNGEIDIMEHLSFDSIVYQTVHSYYTLTLKQQNNPPHYGTAKLDPNVFNVFGLEWNKDHLIFSLNGKETFRYNRVQGVDASQWPFDQSFYLLVDQQLGGNWVGKVNPSHLPVQMIIDWVRVYQ